MEKLTLIIGNKNYSSWSLRPWLLLKYFAIPFEEIRIPLYQAGSRQALANYSPSGLVPVLQHGEITVWDSLAICEYVQDLFPSRALWPGECAARAIARSVSAEMHSGFTALRTHMPMNCKTSFPGKGLTPESEQEIKRITQIWRDCRANYGKGGPMLFGEFSIADTMFAPVVLRFNTYQVELDEVCEAYKTALLGLPAVQAWIAAGCAEAEVLPDFEPYAKT
jgi:glutathione S-transferase